MRLTRLKLAAFGPFAGETRLDFEDLSRRGLVLIHGPTGSGKTSLIDAVIYALYAQTSGERRGRQLRCDRSPASCLTELELDFEVGPKRFRVWRRPEQAESGPLARAEARLWCRSGSSPDSSSSARSSDEGWGRPLAEGWQKVSAAVAKELGMDADSFRQLIVLPQGAFRQLLLASSRERQELFESLWGQERLRSFERALAEIAARSTEAQRLAQESVGSVLRAQGLREKAELRAARRAAEERLAQAREARRLTDRELFLARRRWQREQARQAERRRRVELEARLAELASRAVDRRARLERIHAKLRAAASAEELAAAQTERANLRARLAELRAGQASRSRALARCEEAQKLILRALLGAGGAVSELESLARDSEARQRRLQARRRSVELAGVQERGARRRLMSARRQSLRALQSGASFSGKPLAGVFAAELRAREREWLARADRRLVLLEQVLRLEQDSSSAQHGLAELRQAQSQLASLSSQEVEQTRELAAIGAELQTTEALIESAERSMDELRRRRLREAERDELIDSRSRYQAEDRSETELRASLAKDLSALDHQEPETKPAALEEVSERRLAGLQRDCSSRAAEEARAEERLGQLARAEALLGRAEERLRSAELRAREARSLSELANGRNEARVSFSRFVLLRVFDSVLDCANRFLEAMSSKRYQLRRLKSVEDQRISGGLELEVFDSYSGRLRAVATLSGGESFQAALALALGTRTVLEAGAAGRPLETLFIDEGFGSLDPEALELAVDSLESVAAGRMIAIVSHVQSLSERIPAQIDVRRARGGSSLAVAHSVTVSRLAE